MNHYTPELIDDGLVLSNEAAALQAYEQTIPRVVTTDASLRLKVLDQCGMACTFCHNEGTPVTVDNRGRTPDDFTAAGKSNRVSIFLQTNGARFVAGMVEPDQAFSDSIDQTNAALGVREVHLTGGEPTLHPRLPQVVGLLRDKNMAVKVTSNGENFYRVANELAVAGLSKVVFSIFGTTPQELADIQGAKFNNEQYAALKLRALDRSIEAAAKHAIPASANIVMPSTSHAPRIKRVIDQYGDRAKIRILNSLDEGAASYAAVYELLAELGAEPQQININAGASGMSIDYRLPDGKEVGFKQIRRSYLALACGSCALREHGCEEGYYGIRMYVDDKNQYQLGVCIQRMDMTVPLADFLKGPMPDAITQHRHNDYTALTKKAD